MNKRSHTIRLAGVTKSSAPGPGPSGVSTALPSTQKLHSRLTLQQRRPCGRRSLGERPPPLLFVIKCHGFLTGSRGTAVCNSRQEDGIAGYPFGGDGRRGGFRLALVVCSLRIDWGGRCSERGWDLESVDCVIRDFRSAGDLLFNVGDRVWSSSLNQRRQVSSKACPS